ncbi:hypothetical protein DNI29_19250 [Hymenobacter sediminis]|uniref:DUF5681 domain-containing protein n=1 Tax=Hymenobacter sediminis TaxID=2218621 RepID=UPI000DA66EB6|nr:DUF5681 domain-containing protein [Hymenobacter sediminis]RPD44847.1 hypothetical protein DNI29_19250 [Hymenobacter sediminis]
MAYEKGTSGNPSGRPKGSANKATTHTRELIGAASSGLDADTLRSHLLTLSGKDFIDAYVKLAEFVAPKLQRTALATDDEQKGRVKVTLHIGGTAEQREANARAARELLAE